MDNNKTNEYYISKVIEHLDNIIEYMINIDEEEFFKSKILKSAVCFEFVQVYENGKKITDDILLQSKDFPLDDIRGFRNRLVHEYGEVDYSTIYKSAKIDVPVLINQLKKYLKI